MQYKAILVLVLLGSVAEAKQPIHYESGTLLQMDSTPCGVDEKGG